MKKILPALCVVVAIGLLVTSSCKKNDVSGFRQSIAPTLKLIDSSIVTETNTNVKIYTEKDIETAYTKFYIALNDGISGTAITTGKIELSAVEIGSTAPIPTENYQSSNIQTGLFEASALFTSPALIRINIRVSNNGKTGSYSFNLLPKAIGLPKFFKVSYPAYGEEIYGGFIQPLEPKVGINDFEMILFKKNGADLFVPDTLRNIIIHPVMPDMNNMTSPNNINPVHVGNGHYKGKVNFNMTGGWRIYTRFEVGGVVNDTVHYFDLIF